MRSRMILVLAMATLASCSAGGTLAGEMAPAAGVARSAAGGPGEEGEVLAVIERLFEAFERRDTALAARVLVPEGALHALDTATGALRTQTAEQFFASLAQPGPALHERIFDPVVMIHRDVAMVWTAYDFHVGDVFSHCGVNIFSLARIAAEWKMTSVTYTVEREGCPVRRGR
jgi:hypothetical protein